MSDYFVTRVLEASSSNQYEKRAFKTATSAIAALLCDYSGRTWELPAETIRLPRRMYTEEMAREDFAKMNAKVEVAFVKKVKGDWVPKKEFYTTFDDMLAGLRKHHKSTTYAVLMTFHEDGGWNGWRDDTVYGEDFTKTKFD